MQYTGVVFKLYWICPKCEEQNGLRGSGEREARYINGGPSIIKTCRNCEAEVTVKPCRSVSEEV